ncbi:group II truncated hemoglobin [Marinobacterium jannaschii]|uniref:group II truncated hemoglobin n=1 Tax=Marinobacterium jannaschii TaxID=64970 RepID=UPI00056CF563|nr:group II truncated hemoglobin [Marinobacterium jannaschii]
MQISEPHSSNQPAYGSGDTSFQAAGGEDGIRRLVDAFYDQMEQLPQASKIRAMHPTQLNESRDKLARFLCGWLGGPKLYREKYGPIRIPAAHSHIDIGIEERDAWLLCMEKALQSQPYADGFKSYLMEQLFVPAERCRNRD